MRQEVQDSPAQTEIATDTKESISFEEACFLGTERCSESLIIQKVDKLLNYLKYVLRKTWNVFPLRTGLIYKDFPGGSDGKESACNAGDLGLIPGLGRCPGEGDGNPLQYFCLEKSMGRGDWWAPWGCKG